MKTMKAAIGSVLLTVGMIANMGATESILWVIGGVTMMVVGVVLIDRGI